MDIGFDNELDFNSRYQKWTTWGEQKLWVDYIQGG